MHHQVPTDSGETYAWPAAATAPAQQQAAAPAAGTDRVTQLAELYAQGVVSEEEFAAEKARILNS
ncbi:SHOCT domain-containing protein [Streptomyces sp. NPDC102473]|uniref:SHOCT domain-containing protein n=1 Tax=Streptomyces sp. NPDC102473 TaxID=3366180 RepID=UPI00382D7E04